jgi:hypothetical protein
MTTLTDDVLRRRLAERGATMMSPSAAVIARSVTEEPQRRAPILPVRWPIVGSAAAVVVVAVALVGGLMTRSEPTATGSPPASILTAAASSPATASPIASVIPSLPPVASWASVSFVAVPVGPFEFRGGTTFVADAIADGDGFVAVGYTAARQVVGHVWLTADGRTWRRIDGDWLVGLIPDQVMSIGDRLVMLARRDVPGDLDPVELWTSEDGETWTNGPNPLGATGNGRAAAAGPSGILVRSQGKTFTIGPDLRAWSTTTETWPSDVEIGEPAAGDGFWIQPGATGMGAASAVSKGAIWTSSDGASWEPASLTDPGGVVSSVHRVDGGWVAVGSTGNVGCRVCFGPIIVTNIAWFSATGRDWARIPEPGSPQKNPFWGASFVGDGHRLVAIKGGVVTAIGEKTVEMSAEMTETIDGVSWTAIGVAPTTRPVSLDEAVFVGRRGLAVLPGGVLGDTGPAAWWGEAVEGP